MVARRGAPGSTTLTQLRQRQQQCVAAPPFHELARVVADRLVVLPADRGIGDVPAVLSPVQESETTALVPVGALIPDPVGRVVSRATAGTVEDLLAHGILPSAEVLAGLVPQISAGVLAAGYHDPRLGQLMAATYRAFRNRRSVLLLNLAKQVQFEELPWVQAVAGQRDDSLAGDQGRATAIRVGQLYLQGFPGTLMPNPLVQELAAQTRRASTGLPWVEELAADIFMGAFSAKYLRAAQLAARTLRGSLYARYFEIDYQQILELSDTNGPSQTHRGTGFAALCAARAGQDLTGYSVAANGTVIEQAQILTTHNLATLTSALGVQPADGWDELARRSFAHTCRLVSRVHGNPRPLATVKDAAYAWRHTLFYVSQLAEPDQKTWTTAAHDHIQKLRDPDRERLAPVVNGLDRVLEAQALDDAAPQARRFLGWTTARHWMTT
jgi:hypothetical protein